MEMSCEKCVFSKLIGKTKNEEKEVFVEKEVRKFCKEFAMYMNLPVPKVTIKAKQMYILPLQKMETLYRTK